jgi:hypothetical protein
MAHHGHHSGVKDGHHKTISAKHGSEHGAGPFHKGGALKKAGHHGLIGDGKGHGMKAHKGVHGAKEGHFMASASNVGKLGHK